MRFMTLLKSLPGKYTEAIRLFKHPKVPEEVKIVQFLATFGEWDCFILFEAQSEEVAARFIVQFGEVANSTTLVCFPVEQLHWTR